MATHVVLLRELRENYPDDSKHYFRMDSECFYDLLTAMRLVLTKQDKNAAERLCYSSILEAGLFKDLMSTGETIQKQAEYLLEDISVIKNADAKKKLNELRRLVENFRSRIDRSGHPPEALEKIFENTEKTLEKVDANIFW
ncbi:hypothetical protein GE061_008927 [Apolygus lucorum]|uniref:Uncharacterized protein n=1 Tax=Apolygus lucorum TaxID=248454 RepID=A0A8S9Y0X8_APOLU|nr:hypothetical protein GE061_008927 [Apolygus lucorum]